MFLLLEHVDHENQEEIAERTDLVYGLNQSGKLFALALVVKNLKKYISLFIEGKLVVRRYIFELLALQAFVLVFMRDYLLLLLVAKKPPHVDHHYL